MLITIPEWLLVPMVAIALIIIFFGCAAIFFFCWFLWCWIFGKDEPYSIPCTNCKEKKGG
jgi:hypothetical protein